MGLGLVIRKDGHTAISNFVVGNPTPKRNHAHRLRTKIRIPIHESVKHDEADRRTDGRTKIWFDYFVAHDLPDLDSFSFCHFEISKFTFALSALKSDSVLL